MRMVFACCSRPSPPPTPRPRCSPAVAPHPPLPILAEVWKMATTATEPTMSAQLTSGM